MNDARDIVKFVLFAGLLLGGVFLGLPAAEAFIRAWSIHWPRIVAAGVTLFVTGGLILWRLDSAPDGGEGNAPTSSPSDCPARSLKPILFLGCCGLVLALVLWTVVPTRTGFSIVGVLSDTSRRAERLGALDSSASEQDIAEAFRTPLGVHHFPVVKGDIESRIARAQRQCCERALTAFAGQLRSLNSNEDTGFESAVAGFAKWHSRFPPDIRERFEKVTWDEWGRRAADGWSQRLRGDPHNGIQHLKSIQAKGKNLTRLFPAFAQQASIELDTWAGSLSTELAKSIRAVPAGDKAQFVIESNRADPLVEAFRSQRRVIQDAKADWGARTVAELAKSIRAVPAGNKAQFQTESALADPLVEAFPSQRQVIEDAKADWGNRTVESVAGPIDRWQAEDPLRALRELRALEPALSTFATVATPRQKLAEIRQQVFGLARDRARQEARDAFLRDGPKMALEKAKGWEHKVEEYPEIESDMKASFKTLVRSYRYLTDLEVRGADKK